VTVTEGVSPPRRTVTSYSPARPNRVRSTASATRTSPARAGATKTMSAEEATVTGPKLVQAQEGWAIATECWKLVAPNVAHRHA